MNKSEKKKNLSLKIALDLLSSMKTGKSVSLLVFI